MKEVLGNSFDEPSERIWTYLFDYTLIHILNGMNRVIRPMVFITKLRMFKTKIAPTITSEYLSQTYQNNSFQSI